MQYTKVKSLRKTIHFAYCLIPPASNIGIPGTQMTSIFEGQPPKTRPFPIKTRVIWVLGIQFNDPSRISWFRPGVQIHWLVLLDYVASMMLDFAWIS